MRITLQIAIFFLLISSSSQLIGQTIENFSIDNGGASIELASIEVLYTIGEVVVREIDVISNLISEGFIHPATCGGCLGDANQDNMVNILDLISISSFFGCDENCCGNGDANFDGVVNVLDLVSVSSNFGDNCNI